MNKPTYKAIDAVHTALSTLIDPHVAKIAALNELAERARDDWDEKSETWQESERGQEENDRVETLEAAIHAIEEAIEAFSEAEGNLKDLIQDAPEGSFGS